MTGLQALQWLFLGLLVGQVVWYAVLIVRLRRLRVRLEVLSAETDVLFERYQQLTKRCLEFLSDPYNPRWRDGDIFKGIEGTYGGRGGQGVH
jgi:hypothetical protein